MGTNREYSGNLRNVSAGGLFIETASQPPVGTEILIHFEFVSAGKSPSVSTKGHINRLERAESRGQKSGFSVSTGRMKLHKTLDVSSLGDRV